MADRLETTELFDVEMDELAGALALIAAHWLGRLQAGEAMEAEALQDPADGGLRNSDFQSNLLAGTPFAPQRRDACDDLDRGQARGAFGTRGAVIKTVPALFLVSLDPRADRLRADAKAGGNDSFGLALIEDTPDQFGSTMWGQTGILMHVHSGLPGTLTIHKPQLPRSGPNGQPIETHI